jgi:hypothetical protein
MKVLKPRTNLSNFSSVNIRQFLTPKQRRNQRSAQRSSEDNFIMITRSPTLYLFPIFATHF